MKKVLAFILVLILLTVIWDAPAEAIEGFQPPELSGTVVRVFNKRYAENFTRFLGFYYEDTYTYDELYYHDADGATDWALVRTSYIYGFDGVSYGVFDELVVFAPESYPFTLGYGVYDVKADTFYSIDKAWDMDFADLHDVFVHLLSREPYSVYHLGDADRDGELDIIDVTWIQRCLAGVTELEYDGTLFEHRSPMFGPKLTYLSDFDADGERDIRDAALIQRYLVGLSIYPHSFTLSADIRTDGADAWVEACTSFGREPAEYCYSIDGYIAPYTTVGDDFGDFSYIDPDYEPEPGEFHITTGFTEKSEVELPIASLSYIDHYTLTVTARDRDGVTSRPVTLRFVKDMIALPDVE